MAWSRPDYILCLLRVLGVSFLYAAFFLYEDQEGRIQNRAEEWWIRLSDKQNAARSWAATFMREVARLTERGFDRLFGERLLSFRLAGVSVCFSIASFFLFGLLAVEFSHTPQAHAAREAHVAWFAFLWFVVFGGLALMPAFLDKGTRWQVSLTLMLKLWGLAVVIALLPLGTFLFFVYAVRGAVFAARGVSYLLLAFGFSFACDISYIVLTRSILRRISGIDRVYEILLVILGNLVVLVILLLLPIRIGLNVFQYAPRAGTVITASFILNFIDFVVGFAALIPGLLLLLHRLLWAVVEKPLYAIQRFAPIKNKRLLWIIGIALILLPTHTQLGWLKSLLEKL